MSSEKKRYSPSGIEEKWYKHWLEMDYFSSKPDDREAYTIVIPPPNVTGVLHMGHMLNNTIQDILIRKARLEGKNACWVPGTDHASIATEAKVVKKLRTQGIKKSDLTRDEFLAHAFQWKEEYGGKILGQLQKLGASCDWNRTRFTMEESLSKAVVKVFVDLYKKGRLYRGLRMTTWDCEAQTVLSNEEIIYTEENSNLYHVKYKVEGTEDEWVTIATSRPETILGDTAIAVNPEDERFQHLKGKKVIVPMVNRAIPVIFDSYVDMEFGTGCLKITPAHDPNDHEIGERHNLETIDILNADGTIAEHAGMFVGEDRFEARVSVIKWLKKHDQMVEIVQYVNKVGRSERTNSIVEPRLTLQWFLKMDEFAATALNAVDSGEVNFFPKHFNNMYNSWLKTDNVRDWCISRQLWWGQQIPAWFYKEHEIVAETEEEALKIAQDTIDKNLKMEDLKRDEDVVDTWFSSWLWPLSVFDGFESDEELKYYYPTNVLVTGWDIMFFWVARMVMVGYEWSEDLLGKVHTEKHGKHPFKDVFFTGMVRDNKRRKMSKSLGNSPDALALIEKYGADGVRFGLLSSAAAGNDIVFDAPIDPKTGETLNESKLCNQGLNFGNKMWNGLQFVQGWDAQEGISTDADIHVLAIEWLDNKWKKLVGELEEHYKTYRFSDIVLGLYSFIWNDFFSWYLEMIKPAFGKPVNKATIDVTIAFFEKFMVVLHPIMPFVTEEIWHQLKDREKGDDCTASTYPTTEKYNQDSIDHVEMLKDVISNIRDIRNKNGISPKEALVVVAQKSDLVDTLLNRKGAKEIIAKLANVKDLSIATDKPENAVAFIAGKDKYFVVINKEIDVDAEKERLEKELEHQLKFVAGIEKKLSNERFVNNAPEKVVAMEKKKLADGESRIEKIKENLDSLG